MAQWTGFYKDKPAQKNGKVNGSPSASRSASPSLRSISKLGSSFANLSTSTVGSNKSDADADLVNDLLEVRKALDLFLDSRISEAEAILAPKRTQSMYYSLGYGFILFLKCVMTFENADIERTMEALKHTIHLANGQRKRDGGWLDNITTWVKGNNVASLKSMTRIHRHAELVYAEAYLLKALLSIVHDESIVAFLREGLNIRASYNTYRNLERYIEFVREEAAAGHDISIYQLDDHFTSGVGLGIGCFNIILSLLPSTVVKVAEFMGFTSDREHGLQVLEAVGQWNRKDAGIPPLQGPDEGLRRQLCDMVTIMYHVVLSKMVPLSDIDQPFAERALDYNLKLYPNGVFFLYFSGRLLVSQGKLEEAKEQYKKAIHTQEDWKQLQHICYWELGVIAILQHDWKESYRIYNKLSKESNWSKAVYTYLKALSLYMDPDIAKNEKETVDELMKKVNGSKQKIAGKSIPMEKFVSRKARKFVAQKDYLLLPDLEIMNAFTAFDFMPKELLRKNMERVDKAIADLNEDKEETHNHYDDLCLAHYLRAQIVRFLLQLGEQKGGLREAHEKSLEIVFENASKIELDHYIYYFARYEKARMLLNDDKYSEAETEIQVILRAAEKGHYSVGAGPHAKNKYSLENALVFKCHNCKAQIDETKKKEP